MKQNNFLKTVLLLLAMLLWGASFVWANAGDPTDLPATSSIVLDRTKATVNNVSNSESSNGKYGSIKNNGYILFRLTNKNTQRYTVSFSTGTSNSGSSFQVQILNSSQEQISGESHTYNVFRTGSWAPAFTYYYTTKELSGTSEGTTYYLKVIFYNSTQTYVCNASDITITAGETTYSGTDIIIPDANTITPGTTTSLLYTGSTKNVDGVGVTFDNFGTDGAAIYRLKNNTAQKYKISFKASAGWLGSSLTLKILDLYHNEEKTCDIPVLRNGWSTFNDYSYVMDADLTTGDKLFVLNIKNVNVGPVTISPITQTIYNLTTAVSPTGSGYLVPATCKVVNGESVTLKKLPAWGYRFSKWIVDESDAGNNDTYSYTVSGNKTVTAQFASIDIRNNIPTAAVTYLDVSKANFFLTTNGENKTNGGYATLDNFREGDQAQFELHSTIAQKYQVSFYASTNKSNVKLFFDFASKASPSTTICTLEKEVSGSSFDTYTSYVIDGNTDELPAGDYILTITFGPRNGGHSGTTTNVQRIALTAAAVDVTMDESTDYTPAAKFANVTLTRSITAGNWSTICLPFDMTADQVTATFGDGTKLAGISSYTDKTLNTESVTSIGANVPCFIKVASDFTSATINGVTIKTGTPERVIDGDFKFVGTYTSGTVGEGNYFLKDNQLYKASAKSKIKPFRAYFTGVPNDANARILFFDGDVTGINEVSSSRIHVSGSDYFDLQGRRVIQPTKGLYIVNGRKVVVR